MKRSVLPLALVFLVTFLVGCATVGPNADPLVVRVEQTETIALSTFDTVLSLDNSNREFWKTEVPGFHAFCEWLRAPQQLTTKVLPRGSAMLWSLNEVKIAYKKQATTKDRLIAALSVVESALHQAQGWLSQTQSPKHTGT
jgi:hypothetical protein